MRADLLDPQLSRGTNLNDWAGRYHSVEDDLLDNLDRFLLLLGTSLCNHNNAPYPYNPSMTLKQ